jgi:hypothetical protein
MKFMKYVIALAFVLCVTANVSHAAGSGTIQYLGSGSSGIFLELGQAMASLPDTKDLSVTGNPNCYWTQNDTSGNVAARDDRPGIPTGVAHTDEIGKIVIAWGSGTSGTCAAPVAPYNIYSNMNLDSVIGDRCFFMVSAAGAGCIQVLTVAANTAGASPSLLGSGFTDLPIPADVINTLNGARMQEAATDIRPEDAKFASARMFVACGTPFTRNPYIQTSYQTYGLGYQTSTLGVGVDIKSQTNLGTSFHVYDFNISGNDPLSGVALGARATYAVSVVGAQPEVVVVSPNDGVSGRLATATDIMFSTLSEYTTGNYGRTSDLNGAGTTALPVTALIREPLSGTYNVFEYSVPNSNEFKTSQDISNCTGTGSTATVNQNPMHIPSANGFVAGATRTRALGTSQVVTALKAATSDTLGYFFWSAGNAGGFTATNGKYLTVNGVDPILDSYGDSCVTTAGLVAGQLPNSVVGGLGCVTFKNVNLGDYAIWSAVRIVSLSPVPAGAMNLLNAAQTANSTLTDFIPLSSLKVWKSHYNMFAIGITNNNNGQTVNPATPGDLCPSSAGEGGGDAGAMTISIHGNADFCTDFSAVIGINDKNQ